MNTVLEFLFLFLFKCVGIFFLKYLLINFAMLLGGIVVITIVVPAFSEFVQRGISDLIQDLYRNVFDGNVLKA